MNSLGVVIICHEYPPSRHGGIGTFTSVLARSLATRGHRVRVLGVYPPDAAEPDEEWDQGVHVTRLRRPRNDIVSIRQRFQLYRQLKAWIREGDVDVVECPDYQGWIAGWPRLAVPIVVRTHGCSTYFAAELERQPKRILSWIERHSLRRADSWCSVSRYAAQKTKQLFFMNQDAAVHYNPVELSEPRGMQTREKYKVVYTGTLTPKKGLFPLMNAWPAVLRVTPEAKLHVFGKDQRYGQSTMKEHLISLLDPEQRGTVTFHGHAPREQMLDALRSSRVAVFPSFAEAFALAPMEAMACGCPTIYTKRGSGPELITDGKEGLLVDPASPMEISDAITRVIQDSQLADSLSRKGHQRIAQLFSREKVVQRIEGYYRDCIVQFAAQPH